MSNESGRWTAGEIIEHIAKKGMSDEMFLDKVFYSADKAVLKEDIENKIKLLKKNHNAIGWISIVSALEELLTLSKSEEDSNGKE